MIKILDKKDCCGCHGCFNICPKQCITMKSDNEGFWYPEVDNIKCINCSLCEKVCPILNQIKNKNMEIQAYACKNKSLDDRLNSSSGGMFILLCNYVISKDGVVFGAFFDDKFEVKHGYAESMQECSKFTGSKYVESKIGKTYDEARYFLNSGRVVLFSGTPCQLAGLEKFLGRNYDNLIAVDIACHGVPSPLVFKYYIQELEVENKSKVKEVKFRDKSTGWKEYSFKASFQNNEIKQKWNENMFMKGLIRDLYLRPSCYSCRFKKPTTSVDITLADYWGIENKHNNFDDDKGISLVLVNSAKGSMIMQSIANNLDLIKTDFSYAIQYNPCIVKAVEYNCNRDKFFNKLGSMKIEKLINKYTKISFKNKLKNKLRDIVSKV